MGDKFEQTDRFVTGLKIRKEVLGDAYVDKALEGINNSLQKSHQQYITEEWSKWGRPGLTRQQRSLLNIGILMTLNRSTELGVHVRGAIRNGLSCQELAEAAQHTGMYSGVPACVEASKVMAKVIADMKANGEISQDWDKDMETGSSAEASASKSASGTGSTNGQAVSSGKVENPELDGQSGQSMRQPEKGSGQSGSGAAPLAS